MAYTASTGFRYWKSLSGSEPAPVPVPVRIANSATLRVGDVVRVNTAGFLTACGAGAPVGGILTGFQNQDGINPFSLGYSTGGAGITLTGDDTLATSSSNQTRTEYIMGQMIVDPAGNCLWLNDADGDLSQTNLFQFFDCDANSRQIASGTAGDANGQFQLVIWDPKGASAEPNNPVTADASMGAYRINESQYSGGIDTGTAKNGA